MHRTTFIPAPLPEVFAFFCDGQNLARITPAHMLEIVESPERPLRAGDRMRYRVHVFGVTVRWKTLIDTWKENESFSDVQERGPYRAWRHVHTFRAVGGGTEMLDDIEYELPLGILGRMFGGWLVRRELRRIFDYRAARVEAIFGRAGA